MLLQVISIIAPLFLVVSAGYIYARFEKPDMQVINRMILQLFVPALVFHAMSQKDFQIMAYKGLAIGALAVILFSGVLAYLFSKLVGFKWRTFVPSMMFSNWGNLGIPLVVFTFGEDALNAAIILFVVGNTLQFTLGITLLSGKFSVTQLCKNPVVIAVVLGLLANMCDLTLPLMFDRSLEMLSQATIPLMLLSLGVRLQFAKWGDMRIAITGALFAPIVGLLIAYTMGLILELDPLQAKQLLLFGALPPAVMNYMFAEQYECEPEKVASIVMLGNVFAMVTYFFLLYVIIPAA